LRAADAEEEVAEGPVSLVAEAEEHQDAADPQTESVAQTVVEAAQTAAAVAEEVAVAEEQQGRRAQAALADCPRRLHSFPRQPRPEHRRPLGLQSG